MGSFWAVPVLYSLSEIKCLLCGSCQIFRPSDCT